MRLTRLHPGAMRRKSRGLRDGEQEHSASKARALHCECWSVCVQGRGEMKFALIKDFSYTEISRNEIKLAFLLLIPSAKLELGLLAFQKR
jgi:hypothetical protein